MLLTLYDRNHQQKTVLSANDNSTQVKGIQEDNVLTLSFTLYEHVSLDVNDYVDFMGERYRLTERYEPKEVSTQEWSYDVKFYGIESLIKRFLVLMTTDGDANPVFTLTAPPREHVALIVRCINEGMGVADEWKVGQVDGTDNIVVDYEGTYCDAALKEIAEKVGVEYWVEGQTVNVCRCEHGDEVTLAYGKGLTEIDPSTADNAKFYTRLFPIGSSRNIDREKYGYSRLQLPGGAKYVDVNVDKYGVVHHYERAAFTDIYPRRIGEVSEVRSEEATGEDGIPYKIFYFKDNAIDFNPNDCEIAGLVKRVSFQEGSDLAGLGGEEDGAYYFEVNYNSDTREFEIITIRDYDDGMQLPNDILKPKAGDRYILWNISLADEDYRRAEAEYLTAVQDYNARHAVDVSVYKSPTDHVYIEDNDIELSVGLRVRLESEVYFPETGFRNSRITKITRKVNLPSQMDLEIGDVLSVGSMDILGGEVEEAKSYIRNVAASVPDVVRTGDSTRLTDYNLLSALRTLAEIKSRSLSRTDDDTAGGLITFLEGLVSKATAQLDGGATFGEFVDSLIAGAGAGIDERGNAQVESIEVRSYMKVMELIINRLTAQEGDFNFTESGTIEKVTEIESGTYLLEMRKRWDFDFTAFQEHDVVYGSLNTLLADGSYITSWMRVLSVDTSANTLVVALYPDGEVPSGVNFAPSKGMNISRRGNALNETRQSCWYLSSYEGCIMYLEGVTKPILEESNYYLTLGRPKHLELFNGLPINYSHPYLFARGAIIQDLLRVDFRGNPIYEVVDMGPWDSTMQYIRGKDATGQHIQHQVWLHSCCWRCVAERATIGVAPRWNNTQWVCVVNDNFTLEITSSGGRFFRLGMEYTTLGFVLRHGDDDVSVDAWQVEWTRESGLVEEDMLWNTEHSAAGESFGITPADMPSNWAESRKVSFRCTVYVKDGMEPLAASFSVNRQKTRNMKTASAYILYTPLTVSLFMDERGGSVSQSKSGTDGRFSPDRTLFPLILRPRLEVSDADHVIQNGDRTLSLIDCRWYMGNDETGNRITSGSEGFVLGAYGELQVMRNVEPDTPVPLYFTCAFIDPRNGKTFRKSWSLTLSSTLATELQLSLEIDAASKQPVSPFKSQSVRVINATLRNGEDAVDDTYAVYAWKVLVRDGGGTPSLRNVGEDDLFYVDGQGTKSLSIDRRFIDKELLVLEAYHTAAPSRVCQARTKIYRWYGQWDDAVNLTRGRFIRPDTTEIESVASVQTPKGDVSSPADYFDITHVLTTNERGAGEEVIGYGERAVVPVSKLSKDPNVVPVFGIETRERSALRACVIDGKRVVINGKIMCIQIPICQ